MQIRKQKFDTLRSFKVVIVMLVLAALCWPTFAYSNSAAADDISLISKWKSNLRWTFDVYSRGVFNDRDSYSQNAVGIDLHKVVSGDRRDIGTLILQPYIINLSGSDAVPHFFDGRDTEFVWGVSNFNYRAVPTGALNVRLGRFMVPFGLEQNVNTNGTLRQYSFAERGIKADWGISINGELPKWDYEISLTRGSGNDITDRDNPYIFAGRIGSPAHKNLVTGFSFFDGRVLGPDGSMRRQRLGLDVATYYKHWEFLAELSVGRDEDADTAHGLVEASWRNSFETLHLYTQLRLRNMELADERDSGVQVSIGMDWSLRRALSISGQWTKPLDAIGTQDDSSELTLQLRYRL